MTAGEVCSPLIVVVLLPSSVEGPSPAALAFVLGGLLLFGLFGSMVSTGVGAAELTSTCSADDVGRLPALLAAGLDGAVAMSFSRAWICRDELPLLRAMKCGRISSMNESRSAPSSFVSIFSAVMVSHQSRLNPKLVRMTYE